MVVRSFINSLNKLKENLETASSHSIDLTKTISSSDALYDFKQKRVKYMQDTIYNALLEIKKISADLLRVGAGDKQNEQIAYGISVQVRFLEEFYKQPEKALPIILKIKNLAQELNIPEEKPIRTGSINFKVTGLPSEINEEVSADIADLSKCLASGCHRSCIILCGRILETILHRKYYEATGHDVLEKSPGIGLGNLVGKLKDKQIAFDPGLSQQIHLINQVRIFSVHKKQEAFYPTNDQTHAIILYTLDVVRRMF